MIISLIVLGIIICLALSFFFSGSEVAVVSANRYRLRSLHEEGDATAGRLLDMLGDTQRLLVMVLIGTNLGNVLTALFFKLMIEKGWPGSFGPGAEPPIISSELLCLLLLTPIMVVLAEILPKALFRAHADTIIAKVRPALLFGLFIFKPAIFVIERLARFILSGVAEEHRRAIRQLSRQDILNLVSPAQRTEAGAAEEEGRAEPAAEEEPLGQTIVQQIGAEEESLLEKADERRMVENIIQLHETKASEIMTPLVELVAVDLKRHDLQSFKVMAQACGFSRFPIYRDRIVNLMGYIDIFRVLHEDDGTKRLQDFVEEPYFAPETKRVDDLLQEFLDRRIKNAIVVNEYGGCSGWISREDMLEEIVGELEDELDVPTPRIKENVDGSFLAEGRTEIHMVNDFLGVSFSEEDWETLAGLILHEMGRIPRTGDSVIVGGWRATVTRMEGIRIDEVRLERT